MRKTICSVALIMSIWSVGLVAPIGASATFPGGNGRVAFVTVSGESFRKCCTIRSIEPDGSNEDRLTSRRRWTRASYSPDGGSIALSYVRGGVSTIVVQDLTSGDRSVALTRSNGLAVESLAMAPDGLSIAFCGFARSKTHLYTIDVDGSDLQKLPGTGSYCNVDWSADDRLVATSAAFERGGVKIATMDPDGSNKELLLTWPEYKPSWDVVYEIVPSWSPDGLRIVFGAQRRSVWPDVWTIDEDGSDLTNISKTPSAAERGPVYSPDGTTIAFTRSEEVGVHGSDVWLMNQDGSDPASLVTTAHRHEYTLSWQPL